MKRLIMAGLILSAGCGGGGAATPETAQNITPTTTESENSQTEAPAPEPLPEEDQPPVAETSEPEPDSATPEENLDAATSSSASNYILYIYGADDEFLGFFNKNKFDSYSICNQFGSYGSKFSSKSIWNQFGSYGSDFASLSAFNDFSTSPPILYAQEINGGAVTPIYYITTNETKNPRIDPFLLLSVLQANDCGISR